MNGQTPGSRPAIDISFYSFPLGLRFQQRWVGEQECEFFVEAKTRDGPQQKYVKPGFILSKIQGVDVQAASLPDLSAELAKYKATTGRDRPLKLTFFAVDTSGQNTPLFDPFSNKNERDTGGHDQAVEKYERTALKLPMTTFEYQDTGRGSGSERPIVNQIPLGTNDLLNVNDLRKHTLNLDSDFRTNPTDSTTNFTIALDPPIRNVIRLRLASAEIPNTSYTFTAALRNTTLRLIGPASDQTFTIPDGNYTAAQLQTTIQALFTASALLPAYTIQIHPSTYKTTISSVGAVPFTMDFRTEYNSMEINPDLPGESSDYWGLAYNLGFRFKAYGGADSYVSESIVNVLGEPYLFLRINDYYNLRQPFPDGNQLQAFTKILVRNDKQTVTFNDSSDFLTREIVFQQPTDIRQIRIELVDSVGTTVDLNEAGTSFALEITEVMNAKLYDFYRNYLFRKTF